MSSIGTLTGVLAALGLEPTKLGPAIMDRILKAGGGDKKRRLESIEISALTVADQCTAMLDAVKGRDDETANLIRQQVAESMTRTLLMLAKTADYDDSMGAG